MTIKSKSTMKNGYGLEQSEYEKLVDKFYGFEEYYFYKKTEYYKDYKFVMNLIDDIRKNKPMDTAYKNAVIGYWIYIKRQTSNTIYNHLAINLTDACQLKCKHCYNQDVSRKNKFMTYDEFVFLFNKHQNLQNTFNGFVCNIQNIFLSGGEVTLNPHLFDILLFLYKNNINVYIATNGIQIPYNIINLMHQYKNQTHVQISIDGLKETHEFIRGEGTYDKSVATINKLIELGFDVRANTVINSLNYKDYPKLKNKFGASISRKLLYTPQKNIDIDMCTKEQIQSINFTDIHICKVGGLSDIGYDGSVKICDRIADNGIVANYFTDDIDTIIEKRKKATIAYRSIPVYCFDCQKVDEYLGCSLCNNLNKDIFNQEDMYCHILDRKVKGEMYKV